MNDPIKPEQDLGGISRAELMSALFAQLIMQQSNMAMLLMGKVPNPQTGETIRDIEAARLFIDQLEMLEEKTKGNLSKDEENLLRQSLMSLRMAFVEAVESPASTKSPRPPEGGTPRASPAATTPAATPKSPEERKIDAAAAESKAEDESKKKFTKKY
jgi:hypothetical protein